MRFIYGLCHAWVMDGIGLVACMGVASLKGLASFGQVVCNTLVNAERSRRPQLVKGKTQLYSTERKRYQVVVAHAAAFATAKVPGNDCTLTLIAFATQSFSYGRVNWNLHVIELDAKPGVPGFTKKQVGLCFPPFADDFPVAMQVSPKYGVLYVITKLGLLFIYDLETATAVYRNRISSDPIFATCDAPSTGGFYAINRRGQVLMCTINEQTIVPFVSTQLNNLALAVAMAKRSNLPGAGKLPNMALKVKAVNMEAKTTEKSPTLHQAAAKGDLNAVRCLLDQGAAVDARDELRRTSLHVAAENGKVEVARLLLARLPAFGAGMQDGATPLHLAAKGGHVEMARLLIDEGAPMGARDANGRTPLHLAALKGHVALFTALAEGGAALDAVDQDGKTPISLAPDNGYFKVMQVLYKDNRPFISSMQDVTMNPSYQFLKGNFPHNLKVDATARDLQESYAKLEEVEPLGDAASEIVTVLHETVKDMVEIQNSIREADEKVRNLEAEYNQRREMVHRTAARVRNHPKDTAAVARRDDAITAYEGALQSLQAAYAEKATLSARRQKQKEGLDVAKKSLEGLPNIRAEPIKPPQKSDVLKCALQASVVLGGCVGLLLPAVAATQAAVEELQRCLKVQDEAIALLKPLLVDSSRSGAQVITGAVSAMQAEDPESDMKLAQHLQQAAQLQAKQLAELVARHKAIRSTEVRMAVLLAEDEELHDKMILIKGPLEIAERRGKRGEVARLQQDLETVAARRAAIKQELKLFNDSATDRRLLEVFPEVASVPHKASQLGTQLLTGAQGIQSIIDVDWSLRNFRDGVGRPLGSSHVRLVEDLAGTQWVIKELCRAGELRREGGRLQALQHPLVIPLERIFIDGGLAYLQMPYCKNGSLRSWFEQIKGKTAEGMSLNVHERQQVWATMRQVFEAVAFIHRKGVVHRDLKPENILLQDDGRIALCDFGVSHDVYSPFQTTMASERGGHTVAYAAPEVTSNQPSAKQLPFAQDLWSLGVMLSELMTGTLPTPGMGDVTPGQGQKSEGIPGGAQGDPWVASLARLSSSLLQADPALRPSASDVLSDPDGFLARDLTQVAEEQRRRMHALSSFLESLRRSPVRSIRSHVITLPSLDDADVLVPAVLEEFGMDGLNLLATITVRCGGVHLPLSEMMDRFFQGVVLPKFGLFEQGGEDGGDEVGAGAQLREGVAFLPARGPQGGQTKSHHLKQLRAVGRVLAKAVLECLHVPVRFTTALCCFLVGDEMLANASASDCLELMEEFDATTARRMRAVLAMTHGNGSEHMMTAAMLLGEGSMDEAPLTDTNKGAVVCQAVRGRLVDARREVLLALRNGFLSLDDLMGDQLKLLSGQGLAMLFFGQGYVDVDKAVAAFVFDEEWEQEEEEKQGEGGGGSGESGGVVAWLPRFIRETSETGLRLLGLRAFGSISELASGRCLVLRGDSSLELPTFEREMGCMYLPVNCKDYAAFRSRMERALRAGLYGVRTEAQRNEKLAQEEMEALMGAMRTEIRAGGWYRCPNGHPYAIGECGGAMEEATCPTCGRGIGGQNHRLRADNAHALDIDGAARPAWN
eukprot:jgi/Mesvir1/16377/Mv18122-RA.4